MIILGPPLESREPTRLRSAMLKNLQEFAYQYVCCVPFGGRAIENLLLFYPRLQFLRLSLFVFSRVFVCIYVYGALPIYDVSFFAISRRYVNYLSSVHLLVWFFFMIHLLTDVLTRAYLTISTG